MRSEARYSMVRSIVSRHTWKTTAFLLSTLFVGIWWFAVTIVLLVTGLATAIILIGIPILVFGFRAIRGGALTERWRVGSMLGVDIDEPRRRHAHGMGWVERLRHDASDPDSWKSLAYLWLLLPLGSIWFSLTMVAWAVPLSFLATPLLLLAGIEPTAGSAAGGWEYRISTMPQALAVAAVGVVLLPLVPLVIRAMGRAHAGVASRLLTPSDRHRMGDSPITASEQSSRRDRSAATPGSKRETTSQLRENQVGN